MAQPHSHIIIESGRNHEFFFFQPKMVEYLAPVNADVRWTTVLYDNVGDSGQKFA